jgi:hypothetical protein
MGARIEQHDHTGRMSTETTAQQAKPAEPERSLRAELSARIAAVMAEIEAGLAENSRAAGGASGAGDAQAQLAMLATLQSAITSAQPAALPVLQAKLAWSLPAAQNTVAQMRAATAQATIQAAELASTSEASRRTTRAIADDLFERRIFDPYMKFGSDADEAQYRQREADARRYIDDQLAKNTPTGTLNATSAVAGQLLDAHAHGAGDSADFAPRWNEITQALDKQRSLMRAQGLSTEECDQNLRDSVRRYLAGKGLSPDQIDAQLRQSADPLDAAKPYLRSERDVQALQTAVETQAVAELPKVVTVSAQSPGASAEFEALTASLQARGVVVTDDTVPIGHGVKAATKSGSPVHGV